MPLRNYPAFISYRHADNEVPGRQWATWLHQAIETYEIPHELVGTKNGRGDTIPERIFPIFRDEVELPANADLEQSITIALEHSELLVVLCSPRAVASTYVAEEIDYFKKIGRSDRIIAAIIDGEPNTSLDVAKQASGFESEDECFPVPLQFAYDDSGQRTAKRAEPIAADFRFNLNGQLEQGWTNPEALRDYLLSETSLNRQEINHHVANYQQQLDLMLLKIIAGILGVPLGELTERDKAYQLEQQQQKATRLKRWLLGVTALALIAIITGFYALEKREEAEQAEIVALDNQAYSKMKLMVENWQSNNSASSLQGIADVLQADKTRTNLYEKIFMHLGSSLSTIDEAVKTLSTEVFMWNNNTYIYLDGEVYLLFEGETLHYAHIADTVVLVLPNRGHLVWDTRNKQTTTLSLETPINSVSGIFFNDNLGELFIDAGYLGATLGVRTCYQFMVKVRPREQDYVADQNFNYESIYCDSEELTGSQNDWADIMKTPEVLVFPQLAQVNDSPYIINHLIEENNRCRITEAPYCVELNKESEANALMNKVYDNDALIGANSFIEFRKQFHYFYDVNHGNAARTENICVYGSVFKDCISWNSVTNEPFNDNDSAIYFSEDANLIVIIGGGGSFGDELIVYQYDYIESTYKKAPIISQPFSKNYVGAAILNNQQFIIAVENEIWLYEITDASINRVGTIRFDKLLSVAAVDGLGLVSINISASSDEPDTNGLTFEQFQQVMNKYNDDYWPAIAEAEWTLNLHDYSGNLIWSTSISETMKQPIIAKLMEKSEDYGFEPNIFYPFPIEVDYLAQEQVLFLQLAKQVYMYDELFGYSFGPINFDSLATSSLMKDILDCNSDNLCIEFNGHKIFLSRNVKPYDINARVDERLGYPNSQGVRMLSKNNENSNTVVSK